MSFPVVTVVVAILAIAIYVYYKLKYTHIKKINKTAGSMFSAYLDAAKVSVWGYNVFNDRFFIVESDGAIKMEYTRNMFSLYYNLDDFTKITEAIDDILGGKKESVSMRIRFRLRDDLRTEHICKLTISGHNDYWGKPHTIFGVQQDITGDLQREKTEKELDARIHALFDTLMMDAFCFDKDGTLVDINDHALATFSVDDKAKLLNSKLNLKDMAIHNTLTNGGHWACTMAEASEFKCFDRQKLEDEHRMMYYESMALPMYDLDNNLVARMEIGCDITSLVENLHQVRKQVNALSDSTEDLNRLLHSVDTALLEAKIFRAHYDVNTRSLMFDNWRTGTPVVLSELDCVYMVGLEWRSKIMRVFKRMSKGEAKEFNVHIGTMFKENGAPMYFNFQAVPRIDNDGLVKYYYCMLHDETEMVEAQKVAAKQKAEAQEAEQLHTLFMQNISYEIRTPLNSINGFAELLEMEHDEAEEPIFVEEIRRNTDSLLNMVNDVLMLARIEAKMEEITPETTDIVGMFNSQCRTGWDIMLKPGVEQIVECPFSMLYGSVDSNKLGLIIYNFCMLSAINTKRGYVKATLDYHGNRLFISIIDTGVGFNKDDGGGKFITASNQERDYRTELKLMICVHLVHMLGGTFDVQSKVGEGTTVWVEIPFECIESVRDGNSPDAVQMMPQEEADKAAGDADIMANNAMMIGGSDLTTEGGSFLDSIYN